MTWMTLQKRNSTRLHHQRLLRFRTTRATFWRTRTSNRRDRISLSLLRATAPAKSRIPQAEHILRLLSFLQLQRQTLVRIGSRLSDRFARSCTRSAIRRRRVSIEMNYARNICSIRTDCDLCGCVFVVHFACSDLRLCCLVCDAGGRATAEHWRRERQNQQRCRSKTANGRRSSAVRQFVIVLSLATRSLCDCFLESYLVVRRCASSQ